MFLTIIIWKQQALSRKIRSFERSGQGVFANSGAEANEGAIKLAKIYHYKKAPQKQKYYIKNLFHGRTLATVAATGQEKFM